MGARATQEASDGREAPRARGRWTGLLPILVSAQAIRPRPVRPFGDVPMIFVLLLLLSTFIADRSNPHSQLVSSMPYDPHIIRTVEAGCSLHRGIRIDEQHAARFGILSLPDHSRSHCSSVLSKSSNACPKNPSRIRSGTRNSMKFRSRRSSSEDSSLRGGGVRGAWCSAEGEPSRVRVR